MTRTPIIALAIAGLLTVGGIAGISQLKPVVDFVDTVPEHEGLDAYRTLLDELEGLRFVAFYMPSAGADLRSAEGFDALVKEQVDFLAHLQREAPEAYAYNIGASEAVKQANYMLEKIATSGNARPESYAIPFDPLRYKLARDQALQEESLDEVVAPDGSSALLLVFLQSDTLEGARGPAREMAEAARSWEPVVPRATGGPSPTGLVWASLYTDDTNSQDLQFLLPLTGLAVLGVLFFVLRRPSDVLIAGIGFGAAAVWTFGLLGWMGVRISFLTVFLAPIVMAVGVDTMVHLLHRARIVGTRQALHQLNRPLIVAAASTVCVLILLGLTPAPLFAQIGRTGSIGIGMALLATFIVVAPLRMVWPGKPSLGRDRTGPLLARTAGRAARYPWLAALGLTILLVGGYWGASLNEIGSGDADNEFPQDDPVIVLQHQIEQEYGAFQKAYVIFQGDLTRPATLLAMERAQEQALQIPYAREASSVVGLLQADASTKDGALGIVRGALLADIQPSTWVPTNRVEARDALDRLWEDPMWSKFVPFTSTRDYKLGVVAITLDPIANQTDLVLLQHSLEDLARSIGQSIPTQEVHAGGAPLNRNAVLEQTPQDVALVLLGGSLLVSLVAGLLMPGRPAFRARVALGALIVVLGAGLLAMASVPALDAIYAASGSANVAILNAMFLLAFAVTVGVGVDDWIHLSHARYATGSLEGAWQQAGRSIAGTTATTLVGFLVLIGSYFLQSKNLAILAAVGIASAWMLTYLASLILLRSPARSKTESVPPKY